MKPYSASRRAAITVVMTLVMLVGGLATTTASEPFRAGESKVICVVVPHFKDEYWLSVGFGLAEQAKVMGASLLIYEAGGYHALDRQIELLETCRIQAVDVILLGAVSADDTAMLRAVEAVSREIPVVSLVNELRAQHLSAAVGVSWHEMGLAIGEYLALTYPKGGQRVSAALITGPAHSGWSPLLERGLISALSGSAVVIDHTGRSDTGLREQLSQVEAAIRNLPELDLVIGSAPAIEGAMGLAANSDGPFPRLVATYISHSVRRGLQSGAVSAVAFDDPVQQGRMGIRMALAARPGAFSLGLAGPHIQVVQAHSENIRQINLSPASLALQLE